MANPPALTFAEVYLDESSQTKHRYLVIGGIIMSMEDRDQIIAAIVKARRPELPAGEMKWNKVSKAKLPAYRRVVDEFFALQRRMTLDFHCLVIDTTKLNHHAYNQGSSEIGFNKEVYQIAMKFGLLYNCLIHVYPDRRTTTQSVDDLRLMLNRGIASKYRDKRDWPFRRLQFRDPETTLPLQLVDILIGAVAYRLNKHDQQPEASPAKVELSAYILRKAGIAEPMRDTARRGKFTIWHRQLRGVPRP